MHNSMPSTTPPNSVDQLHTLQTEGRTREPYVEAQVTLLLSVPRTEFWRRAAVRERTAPEQVSEEALVSVLRIWSKRGDRDAAWRVAELLVERSARFTYQHISYWKQLSSSQVEECIRDVQVCMIQDLMDEGRGSEFWEVRFWLCLKRRLLNIVQRYRATAEAEFQPAPIEDGEGHTTDAFERMVAPCAIDAQGKAEMREALALLPEQERMAFYLYHYEDWPQQDIATHLKVTDRTVRNLLARAEKRLQGWRIGSVN